MTQTKQQAIHLSPEEKENLADELLTFMKNELENCGRQITTTPFDFQFSYTQQYIGAPDEVIQEGKALSAFKENVPIDDSTFSSVMNYCFTNQYVKRLYIGTRQFDNVCLTEKGFARATSVVKARYKKPATDNAAKVHIGVLNADNLQIGDNNVQNITSTFQYLIDEINKSNATEEEKKNALSKLQELIYNPLICNILSSGVVESIKVALGV